VDSLFLLKLNVSVPEETCVPTNLRGIGSRLSWSFADIGLDMEAPGDLRSKLMGQQNPQSDWAVLKTVLFYSVLILVLPIGSFFATKSLLFEWFLGQTATIGTNIVSAVVAVIVLHLALGLFIYKAYFDDGKKSIKSD